jgi:hypothetical protein
VRRLRLKIIMPAFARECNTDEGQSRKFSEKRVKTLMGEGMLSAKHAGRGRNIAGTPGGSDLSHVTVTIITTSLHSLFHPFPLTKSEGTHGQFLQFGIWGNSRLLVGGPLPVHIGPPGSPRRRLRQCARDKTMEPRVRSTRLGKTHLFGQ